MLVTLLSRSCVAVPIGVLAAWKAGTWIDRVDHGFRGVRLLGAGVRDRLSARIYVFALELDWLPVQGYTPLARRPLAVAARI